MSSIDGINSFEQGQIQLDANDLNLMAEFLKVMKKGINGVAPIRVSTSELFGFQISIDGQEERLDFSIDSADTVKEDGVIIPTFAAGTGLNSDNNYLGETASADYAGSRWTFFNKSQGSDGTNDTLVSTVDTSKPFIAEVSASVVSGDWVGVKSGSSLLQKDYPGFKVLADTSGLTGGTTALLIRRPVDGMLAKASVAILTDASGNVKLSEVGGTTQGGNFSATNKGSDVAIGDFVQLGEDANGAVFFKATASGGGVACECQDLLTIEKCFEVSWFQDVTGGGQIGGVFYVPVTYTLIDTNTGLAPTSCENIAELLCGSPCNFEYSFSSGNSDTGANFDTKTLTNGFPYDNMGGSEAITFNFPGGTAVTVTGGSGTFTDISCGDVSVDIFVIDSPMDPNGDCTSTDTGDTDPCSTGDPRSFCNGC